MASDNFTRANENPIASPWSTPTGFGAMQLLSNTCQNTALATDSACRYATAAANDSQVVVGTVGSGDCGPGFFTSSGNGYTLNGNGGNLSILRFAGGAFSAVVASVSGSWVTTNTLRLRRSGGNLIGSVNGVDLVTGADSTYLTCESSIHDYDGTSTFTSWTDNVGGGGDSLMGMACL